MKSIIPFCLFLASGVVSAAPAAESATTLLDYDFDFEPTLTIRDELPSDVLDDTPDATDLPEDAWTYDTSENEDDNDDDGGDIDDARQVSAAKGGRGHAVLHNRINKGFQYVLIGPQDKFPNGVVKSGFVKQGKKVNFPYSARGQPGYSLKIAYRGQDGTPNQFEYAVDANGKIFYDYSAIDGDPFRKFRRTVVPSKRNQPGYFCKPITCPAGSEKCAYEKGKPGDPVFSCPSSVNLGVFIGKKGKD